MGAFYWLGKVGALRNLIYSYVYIYTCTLCWMVYDTHTFEVECNFSHTTQSCSVGQCARFWLGCLFGLCLHFYGASISNLTELGVYVAQLNIH